MYLFISLFLNVFYGKCKLVPPTKKKKKKKYYAYKKMYFVRRNTSFWIECPIIMLIFSKNCITLSNFFHIYWKNFFKIRIWWKLLKGTNFMQCKTAGYWELQNRMLSCFNSVLQESEHKLYYYASDFLQIQLLFH